MTQDEFMEWQAYQQVEPFEAQRSRLHATLLIRSIQNGPVRRPTSLERIWRALSGRQPRRRQSAADMETTLRAYAARFNRAHRDRS